MSITAVDGVPTSTSRLSSIPYSDPRRWYMVYPIYINAGKTVAEGRKVPKSMAVRYPSLADLYEALHMLRLPVTVEKDKRYSRDALTQIGRVRVQLRNDSGQPLHPSIPNKEKLLRVLCEEINKLPSHTLRASEEEKAEAKFMQLYMPATSHVDKQAKQQQKLQAKQHTNKNPTSATATPSATAKKKKKGRR
jgi:signal recognition particle subunit SRP19